MLGDAGSVYDLAQGKKVMDWRLPGPEACLGRAIQLELFRPPRQPPVENDGAKGLAHGYGPVVDSIECATFLVDGSDERRGDAGWRCTNMEAVVEDSGEKGGQDPDIVTAATIHGDINVQHIAAAQQVSQPHPTALPLERFGRARSASCCVTSASRTALRGWVEG